MRTLKAQRVLDWAILAVMAGLGFFMLLPFAWLFSMSFRSVADAYRMPPSFIPPSLDLANYRAVLNSSVPFLRIYANSVEIAVIVTIGQLVTCTLAAFAFARLKFPGRDSLFFIMLVGLMFPAQVTIIPIYLGFAKVGLLNRPIGLALMYLTSSFGVFLVRQFMQSQPIALEEAALMDGAGYFKIIYRISLPQLRPALSALGISPVHWLTSSRMAMTSIVIMDVWKNAGFFMIIFIAALQGVPKPLMEAAAMDGASYARRFFKIVLPWISPVVFFAIVYASIGALQVFESISILTRGGPGDATRSMSIYIVEEAFDSFEIGYAASVAVVMTVVILAITALQLLASRRWVRH